MTACLRTVRLRYRVCAAVCTGEVSGFYAGIFRIFLDFTVVTLVELQISTRRIWIIVAATLVTFVNPDTSVEHV